MATRRFMLDTNIVSAYMKGNPSVDERLSVLDPDEWCISAITRAELRFGAELSGSDRLQQLVEDFVTLAQTLPWDASAADTYGRLRAQLRKAGTPIGPLDEMIASHALATNLELITNNTRHFEKVPGLTIRDWI